MSVKIGRVILNAGIFWVFLGSAITCAQGICIPDAIQSSIAEGTVYLGSEKHPLSDVRVEISGYNYGASVVASRTTAINGRFVIPDIKPGRYWLHARHPVVGYMGVEFRVRSSLLWRHKRRIVIVIGDDPAFRALKDINALIRWRVNCQRTASASQRQPIQPVFPLRCFRCQPDEQQFIDCRPNIEALRDEEWNTPELCSPALPKARKCAGIVPTSCETSTRWRSAASAKTSESFMPRNPAACAVKKSRDGSRRKTPFTIALFRSASARNRTFTMGESCACRPGRA